jgi:hypothetical protein
MWKRESFYYIYIYMIGRPREGGFFSSDDHSCAGQTVSGMSDPPTVIQISKLNSFSSDKRKEKNLLTLSCCPRDCLVDMGEYPHWNLVLSELTNKAIRKHSQSNEVLSPNHQVMIGQQKNYVKPSEFNHPCIRAIPSTVILN